MLQRKVGVIRDFAASLEALGGIQAAVREFGAVQLLDAGLRELWFRIGMRALRVLRPRTAREYGWLEALFFPAYDYWLRYAKVIESLAVVSRNKPLCLLEVSSGRGGIAWFLDVPEVQVCLVDQTVEILNSRHSAAAWRVCADACVLPFSDAAFDVVVSVDTVEHIPRARRAVFLQELKRVAAQGVIVSCPLDSTQGRFRAREFDLRLQHQIRQHKKKVPRWLEDHIEKGHPTEEELMEVLKGAEVKGSQNCESWLRFASFYLRPLVWLVAGFFYLLVLKKHELSPPHWRGVLVWQKRYLATQDGLA